MGLQNSETIDMKYVIVYAKMTNIQCIWASTIAKCKMINE